MHEVKNKAVADGQALMPGNENNAFSRRKFIPLAAVIHHGEPVIITFHEKGDQRCDPAHYRQQGKQHEAYHVNRLPQCITKGKPDAPPGIFHQLCKVEREIPSFNNGGCFFTQVRKYRRANDEEHVFKQREVKKDHDQPEHHAGHHEQKAEQAASLLLQPGLQANLVTDPAHGIVGRNNEKINSRRKKQHVNNAGYQNPFPQVVLPDKLVRFRIGLDGYNDFFQQMAAFSR